MVIKTLIIDDDENISFLLNKVCQRIKKFSFEISISDVLTLEGVINILHSTPFDLIFLDYRLEEQSGLEILQGVRSHGFLMPIILMTALGDDHLVRDFFRMGGNDYLSKVELTPKLVEKAVSSCMKNYEHVLELQQAKDKAESLNRTKNLMLTMINHQFKTPLNGIQGSAQSMKRMLKKNTLTPERLTAYLHIIQNSAHELNNMINEVLEVAHLEKGIQLVFESVLLSSIVAELMEVESYHLEIQNLQFTSNIPEGLTIIADKQRLYQILRHLIDNAAKFTESGTIHIQAEREKEHVVISVQDTGIGISKEKLPYIFEWFSQIDPSGFQTGLGLGLNICKKLMERMNGEIWAESVINSGSTFYLKLPIASTKEI